MNPHLISFLVIFYNQQDYVENALNHILNIQIPKGFEREILIGDDGSTDNTQKIIQNYLKKYKEMQLFIMPRNKTTDPSKRSGENRLNLLKHAKGIYFCISDGDDYYSNNQWILKAISILNNDLNLSIAAFQHEIINENNEKNPSTTLNLKNGKHNIVEYIQTQTYTHAAACLFRTPNLKQLDFLIQMNSFVDTHIVLSFLTFGDIYITQEIVYSYKANGGIWLSYNEAEQHLRIALSFCFLSYYFPQYQKAFKKTHFHSLVFLFENRQHFWELLKIKEEKSIYYKEQFKQPINLLLNQILNFDSLNYKDKKTIQNFFKGLLFLKIKKKIKNSIDLKNYYLNGVKYKIKKIIHNKF